MPNAEHRQPDKTRQRQLGHLKTLVSLGALTAVAISASNSYARPAQQARAARVLNVTDTAHLHLAHESGSMLIDQGSATGALPGTVTVEFSVGATVRATFTIRTRNGAIVGRGSGALSEHKHDPGHRDVYASFGGKMTVSHGTGRYAHAHGTGGFYGVINRETYAVTIQTTGTLSY
jgi:hypothetical protein